MSDVPQPTTAPDSYLTPAEAAELLRCSLDSVRRYIRTGDLPAYRFSERIVRIRHEDFLAFVNARRAL